MQSATSTWTQNKVSSEASNELPFSNTTISTERNVDVTTSASTENLQSIFAVITDNASKTNATEHKQSATSTSTQSNLSSDVSTKLPFSTTTMATGRNVDVTSSASSVSDVTTQHPSENIKTTFTTTEKAQSETSTSTQNNLGPKASMLNVTKSKTNEDSAILNRFGSMEFSETLHGQKSDRILSKVETTTFSPQLSSSNDAADETYNEDDIEDVLFRLGFLPATTKRTLNTSVNNNAQTILQSTLSTLSSTDSRIDTTTLENRSTESHVLDSRKATTKNVIVIDANKNELTNKNTNNLPRVTSTASITSETSTPYRAYEYQTELRKNIPTKTYPLYSSTTVTTPSHLTMTLKHEDKISTSSINPTSTQLLTTTYSMNHNELLKTTQSPVTTMIIQKHDALEKSSNKMITKTTKLPLEKTKKHEIFPATSTVVHSTTTTTRVPDNFASKHLESKAKGAESFIVTTQRMKDHTNHQNVTKVLGTSTLSSSTTTTTSKYKDNMFSKMVNEIVAKTLHSPLTPTFTSKIIDEATLKSAKTINTTSTEQPLQSTTMKHKDYSALTKNTQENKLVTKLPSTENYKKVNAILRSTKMILSTSTQIPTTINRINNKNVDSIPKTSHIIIATTTPAVATTLKQKHEASTKFAKNIVLTTVKPPSSITDKKLKDIANVKSTTSPLITPQNKPEKHEKSQKIIDLRFSNADYPESSNDENNNEVGDKDDNDGDGNNNDNDENNNNDKNEGNSNENNENNDNDENDNNDQNNNRGNDAGNSGGHNNNENEGNSNENNENNDNDENDNNDQNNNRGNDAGNSGGHNNNKGHGHGSGKNQGHRGRSPNHKNGGTHGVNHGSHRGGNSRGHRGGSSGGLHGGNSAGHHGKNHAQNHGNSGGHHSGNGNGRLSESRGGHPGGNGGSHHGGNGRAHHGRNNGHGNQRGRDHHYGWSQRTRPRRHHGWFHF
ncbi:basic-leucine zipper transcription factor A-like [Aricia agestis]|uniref:basic-leucine zipper transcription factor A-like n=1 Tax=Aricia agestis TaxID=91739 RepID=UPI001C2033A0|nr:basic-leucine zipper transcription factor A-like [Aricia agestis]